MDDWGWVFVVGFWTVIFGGSILGDAIKDRREAKAKASRPLSVEGTVELEKACPNCNRPLRGMRLTSQDIAAEPPMRAWRVCFECGHEEQWTVTPPWTLAQGDAIRAGERRQQEREMIAEFFRNRHLRQVSTFEGLVGSTPREFEQSVAEILRANGYHNVYVSGGAGDLAVDIQAVTATGEKVAVQCKRYTDKPVGSKEMQTFIGMIHQHHGINSGLYVTTSRFTKPAEDLARRHNIELVDKDELLRMARILQPKEVIDEKKMRSLEMWDVVMREKKDEADRRLREAELERRRRGRRWAYVNRQY